MTHYKALYKSTYNLLYFTLMTEAMTAAKVMTTGRKRQTRITSSVCSEWSGPQLFFAQRHFLWAVM